MKPRSGGNTNALFLRKRNEAITMKKVYTLSELNETIEVMQNFFDKVTLLDPVQCCIVDRTNLETAGSYPEHWVADKSYANRTDIRALKEQRRLTKLQNRGSDMVELQFHYVCVDGHDLVLRLEANMTESMSTNPEGQQAVARNLQDVNYNVYRDYVTGAYNRQYLDNIYSVMVPKMIAEGRNVCFAMVSVDKLREIHEKYGLVGKDNVMAYVVGLLRQQIDMDHRDGIVAKLGGSSVVVSCEGKDYADFVEKIRALNENARKECLTNIYKRVKFTMSIATADWSEAPDWQSMAALLDERMLAARRQGGNCVVSE